MRLGKNQKALLKKMNDEKLVIRYIRDYTDGTHSIILEDEEGNEAIAIIPEQLFASLPKECIDRKAGMCSMQLEVYEYRISKIGAVALPT